MQLGAEGLFVGSGIFKAAQIVRDGVPAYDANGYPEVDASIALRYAKAIVDATTHFTDAEAVVAAHKSLEGARAMHGIDVRRLDPSEMLSARGN